MTSPILWLLSGLLLLAVPGPTNALLATAGAELGRRQMATLIAAELLGYGITITLLSYAGNAVVGLHPTLAHSLRLACAFYISWIAFTLWRGAAHSDGEQTVGPAQVLLTTLVNPKAALFAFVILPALSISGFERLGFLMLLGFGAGFIAACWIAFGASARQIAGATPRLLSRIASLALAGFAMALIGSELWAAMKA